MTRAVILGGLVGLPTKYAVELPDRRVYRGLSRRRWVLLAVYKAGPPRALHYRARVPDELASMKAAADGCIRATGGGDAVYVVDVLTQTIVYTAARTVHPS